jgi:chemotaxis protein MotB
VSAAGPDMDDLLEDEDDEPTAPFWMTTYSDMVTLLLTFFVLIVSMSEVEVRKFKEALSHFQGRRSVLEFESIVPPTRPEQEMQRMFRAREGRLDELAQYLRENQMDDKIQVSVTERGVHVSIVDSVMFDSGSAVLLFRASAVLEKVGQMLTPLARLVIVEGHTDDRPINTAHFPSNWELSGARASSVVRFFLQQEDALGASQYKTVGFGEFRPIATNQTPEGRARNRRVEILFSHAGTE